MGIPNNCFFICYTSTSSDLTRYTKKTKKNFKTVAHVWGKYHFSEKPAPAPHTPCTFWASLQGGTGPLEP